MKANEQLYPTRDVWTHGITNRLMTASISSENRDFIERFRKHLRSKGNVREIRIAKLTYQLIVLSRWLKSPLFELNKDRAVELISRINADELRLVPIFTPKKHRMTRFVRRMWSAETRADYRRSLKQAMQWYKEEDPRLDSLDMEQRMQAKRLYQYLNTITVSVPLKEHDHRGIITDEDADFLVDKGCKTTMQKAFIKTLHESGCRAGEFLTLRLRDIEVRGQDVLLNVHGKTGNRSVPLVESLPLLTSWMSQHPDKDNSEAYLWLTTSGNKCGEPFGHRGAAKLVHTCCTRAGFKKKHNLHWFRHSRASLYGDQLSEQVLCRYGGWVMGSRMVRRYCHLSPTQVENAILRSKGLHENGNKRDVLKCSCGSPNPPNSRFCFKCGKPLSGAVAIQEHEKFNNEMEKTLDLFMRMAKDEKMMEQFEDFIKKSRLA